MELRALSYGGVDRLSSCGRKSIGGAVELRVGPAVPNPSHLLVVARASEVLWSSEKRGKDIEDAGGSVARASEVLWSSEFLRLIGDLRASPVARASEVLWSSEQR